MSFDDAIRRFDAESAAARQTQDASAQQKSELLAAAARRTSEAISTLRERGVPTARFYGRHVEKPSRSEYGWGGTYAVARGQQDVEGWLLDYSPRAPRDENDPRYMHLLRPQGDFRYLHHAAGGRRRSSDGIYCACSVLQLVVCPDCPVSGNPYRAKAHVQFPEHDSDNYDRQIHGEDFDEWLTDAVAIAIIRARGAN